MASYLPRQCRTWYCNYMNFFFSIISWLISFFPVVNRLNSIFIDCNPIWHIVFEYGLLTNWVLVTMQNIWQLQNSYQVMKVTLSSWQPWSWRSYIKSWNLTSDLQCKEVTWFGLPNISMSTHGSFVLESFLVPWLLLSWFSQYLSHKIKDPVSKVSRGTSATNYQLEIDPIEP